MNRPNAKPSGCAINRLRKRKTPRRKRGFIWKLILSVLLLIAIYFVYGLIGPYIGNKEVDLSYQKRFSTVGFYAGETEISPDRVKLLTDRVASEAARLNIIDRAVSNLSLAVDSASDERNLSLMAGALLDAADRDVQVKILVDGANRVQESALFQALSTHENIEIREYRPVHLLLPWTYNSRMNDRFIVADDQLAWFSESTDTDRLSGSNTDIRSSDWDLLIYNEAANTRNTAGSVLSELKNYFTALWTAPDTVRILAAQQAHPDGSDLLLIESLTDQWKDARKSNPDYNSTRTDYRATTIETDKVTLVKNPLSDMNKQPYVWFQLQKLMAGAKERVLIQTPYILMSPDMYKGMEIIKANVADVKIMTNSPACAGNFKEASDYSINRREIINTGVQLSEYQGSSAFIPKVLLIDDDLTVLGSYHYNLAGTYLNTESVLVIQSEALNQQVTTLTQEISKETLIVKPDGSYSDVAQVPARTLDGGKQFLQFIAGLGLQLFRSLL